jgi:ribonuclease HI
MSITIYFDAACKPNNPGELGLGWVINGDEYCEYDGVNTNNVGEYRSLLRALETLHEKYDINQPVTIYGDSKLVVEQVNGRWRVKKPHLRPLCDRAKALLKGLDYSLKWIPREQNTQADRMSNEAYKVKTK